MFSWFPLHIVVLSIKCRSRILLHLMFDWAIKPKSRSWYLVVHFAGKNLTRRSGYASAAKCPRNCPLSVKCHWRFFHALKRTTIVSTYKTDRNLVVHYLVSSAFGSEQSVGHGSTAVEQHYQCTTLGFCMNIFRWQLRTWVYVALLLSLSKISNGFRPAVSINRVMRPCSIGMLFTFIVEKRVWFSS